jgi:hypothetical protein
MEINVAQGLASASVSLLVGAVSAWVAGTLGVRHGLRRAQREKAFERRLEWYERSFRVMSRFQTSVVEFDAGIRLRDLNEHDRLLEALGKSVAEVENCLHEAALFAERAIIREMVQLHGLMMSLIQATQDMTPPNFEQEKQLTKVLYSIRLTMRAMNLKIAQGVREQLALDEIESDDLAISAKPAKQGEQKK